MELKDFIEQSVSDIVEATQNLKQKYNNGYIETGFEENPISPTQATHLNKEDHSINFDIAVTTSENGTAKAGTKIGISVLGANMNGEKGYINEQASRIKFSIPFYPEFIAKN